jgi:hypothetical protein
MCLYIRVFASEPCFTGIQGVLYDANILVPVCQMPSNHQQIQRLTGVCTGTYQEFDRGSVAQCALGTAQGMAMPSVCIKYMQVCTVFIPECTQYILVFTVFTKILQWMLLYVICLWEFTLGNNMVCAWHVCYGA